MLWRSLRDLTMHFCKERLPQVATNGNFSDEQIEPIKSDKRNFASDILFRNCCWSWQRTIAEDCSQDFLTILLFLVSALVIYFLSIWKELHSFSQVLENILRVVTELIKSYWSWSGKQRGRCDVWCKYWELVKISTYWAGWVCLPLRTCFDQLAGLKSGCSAQSRVCNPEIFLSHVNHWCG